MAANASCVRVGKQIQKLSSWNNLKGVNLMCGTTEIAKARRSVSRFQSSSSSSSSDDNCPKVLQENVTTTKFQIPQHYPNKLDRITLIATRTMKAHEIGDEVSFDAMQKANARRRIAVNMSLMVLTLFGSIYAIWQGKKEKETNNVYEINKRR